MTTDWAAYFKQWLTEAEFAWVRVVNSPTYDNTYQKDGYDYTPLPQKYNSYVKVGQFLREHWSPDFAKRMICNMKLDMIEEKLCAAKMNPPALPAIVESLRILEHSRRRTRIRAVLADEIGRTSVIYYQIEKQFDQDRFMIVKRSDINNDPRYQPCEATGD